MTMSSAPSGPVASTDPSRREKSNACLPARVQPCAAFDWPATSAASSEPRSPPSFAAMAPSRAARASSLPAASRLLASVISAEVSVPVLSVHKTVMAPRSWIAARRLTITLRPAMRSAPRDSVTVVIIGSSSGVSPTASATANSNESITGRPNTTRTLSTTSTNASVARAITRPNSRKSRSNGEGVWASASAEAAAPNTVSRPVLTTSAIASPVCATAPRNSAFDVSSGSVMAPARFCTG
ncbi:hypothetical protein ACVWWO_006621 [Bradyrhizobium sp. F1.13.1]